eukprot:1158471-Pelagomonas_calceolata.AAC.9
MPAISAAYGAWGAIAVGGGIWGGIPQRASCRGVCEGSPGAWRAVAAAAIPGGLGNIPGGMGDTPCGMGRTEAGFVGGSLGALVMGGIK